MQEEHHVEYEPRENHWNGLEYTHWASPDGLTCADYFEGGYTLITMSATPMQAVQATLGHRLLAELARDAIDAARQLDEQIAADDRALGLQADTEVTDDLLRRAAALGIEV